MENKDDDQRLYYTLDEVREKIFGNHISKGTLFNMVKNKTLPVVRMMSRYYVPVWWVNKQIKKATTEPDERQQLQA